MSTIYTHEITIPFSGFYESIHSVLIDDAISNEITDNAGEEYPDLRERLDKLHIPYRAMYKAYASAYTEYIAHELDLDLQFELLNSPREYNFVTDMIVAKCPTSVVGLMYEVITRTADNLAAFEDRVKQVYTSCSGFHSYYSPDYTDWGIPIEWDHNQLGTLLEVYMNLAHQYGYDPSGCYDIGYAAHGALSDRGTVLNIIHNAFTGAGDATAIEFDALCSTADERRDCGVNASYIH